MLKNPVAISIINIECLKASPADIRTNFLEIWGSEAAVEKRGTIEECRTQAHKW
jgi:hypothetical protein